MIRKEFITHIDRDSAALGVLDSIAHTVVEKPGRYELVSVSAAAVRVATLVVDESGPQSAAVDLALVGEDAGCGCGPRDAAEITVAPGGLLTLAIQSGFGPFHALIRADNGKDPVFDSRRLGAGDLVAFVLLRPGTYKLAGALQGEVVVTYPERGADPSIAKEPVRIASGRKGRQQRAATVSPGQPIVVELADGGAVTATLVAPDDGPERERRRPRAPQAGRTITVRVVPKRA